MHQKRNRSICPLKLIPYCNHGETSLTVSHHAIDTSKASHCQPVDHAVPWPHHANDTSKASHLQPVDHTDADTPNGNQDNDGANEEIEHGSNNNDTDDEDEDEDTEVNAPKQQPCTFNNNIHPSQLHFYSGTWINVLIIAKNSYRLFIHTNDPFPKCTAASLEDAHICLINAIGKFKEESRLPLNEGNLIQL